MNNFIIHEQYLSEFFLKYNSPHFDFAYIRIG